MKSAVGNSLLLYLVVIFSGIVILFFVGIISYSKAYRVKNRIVDVIEKHSGYDNNTELEINSSLKEMGYNITSSNPCNSNSAVQNHMKNISDQYALKNTSQSGYNYCVYEISNKSSGIATKYYVVVTFVNFKFPIIGSLLNIPIYGETKILGKSYDY